MPHNRVVLHRFPPQIKITIFKPHILPYCILMIYRKRQLLTASKHFNLRWFQFNFSSNHLLIDHTFRSCNHLSMHTKHIFRLYLWKSKIHLGRITSNLRNSIAISEVNKGHSSKVSGLVHPTSKDYFISKLCFCEFSTSVCTIHEL